MGKYTVADDELQRVTKVLGFGGREFETILTKEMFVECYKRWILGEREETPKVEVGSLEPGEVFELAEIQWEVLDNDHQALGVFCLTKDILSTKAFDKDNCNNWAKSSLRKYLNGVFKNELIEKIGANPFKSFDRDLMSDDGMTDYGGCTDYISLLSNDEYRKYRRYISDKSDCWWTLTPHSCLERFSNAVRFVYSNGSFNNAPADSEYYSVAPVVFLNSGTLVSVEIRG